MAAQISSDMDNTDKVVHMVNECGDMNVNVLPPNINSSEIHFKPCLQSDSKDDKTIKYGLGGIKGAGEAALDGVINDRKAKGDYRDLFDFCLRVGKKVNRRVLEALIRSGAFDCLHSNRQAVLDSASMALKQAEQQLKNDEVGQNDLFGEMLSVEETGSSQLLDVPEMSEKLRLRGEKETLGHYMSGHPIDMYRKELKRLVNTPLSTLVPEKWKKRTVAGLVVELRNKVTRNGQRMGFAILDDKTARLDIVMRPAVYEAIRSDIKVDTVVLVTGEVAEDNFNGGIKLDAEQIVTLAEARVEKSQAIQLTIIPDKFSHEKLTELAKLLQIYQAERGLPITVKYANAQAKVTLKSTNQHYFPDDELLETLNAQGWLPEVI